ncbi:MAG: hypothetical protein PHY13_10525 [Clostridia bacterium]|nr:hypothetical protein [Clostridia bacterium]HXK72602.1 hypothetical protein [Clostridia bacterium]
MNRSVKSKNRISNKGGNNMKGDLFERIITRNKISRMCEKRCNSIDIYEYQHRESRKLI